MAAPYIANYGSIFSSKWTEVHEILGRCRGPFVVSNVVSPMVYNLYHVPRRRYWPSKVATEVVENR